ncbi:hypothetical protein MUK42_05345, partial [Musa troglodytarum]
MTTRITPGVGANLLGQHSAERNRDATTYVGNLDPHLATQELEGSDHLPCLQVDHQPFRMALRQTDQFLQQSLPGHLPMVRSLQYHCQQYALHHHQQLGNFLLCGRLPSHNLPCLHHHSNSLGHHHHLLEWVFCCLCYEGHPHHLRGWLEGLCLCFRCPFRLRHCQMAQLFYNFHQI